MIYIGIGLLLAFLFWSLYNDHKYGPMLRATDNKIYKSRNTHTFDVSVNYHVSALIKHNLKKLIALSVTITNKKDTDLNNLRIVAEPGHRMLTIRDMETLNVHHAKAYPPAALGYNPMDGGNINIEPMQMESGYLIFEAENDYCDIDKLIVTCNEEVEEVAIRKEDILDEKTVQLL